MILDPGGIFLEDKTVLIVKKFVYPVSHFKIINLNTLMFDFNTTGFFYLLKDIVS